MDGNDQSEDESEEYNRSRPEGFHAPQESMRILLDATAEERIDEGLLKARIQSELKRFLRRQAQRRPLILPVILEL